jgi:hypothetical protein
MLKDSLFFLQESKNHSCYLNQFYDICFPIIGKASL